MEKGLVSIVVPCYNAEDCASRFLNSIINQTYKKIQLIIVDDGSTDKTYQVLQEYKSKMEKEGIQYICIQQKINQGQAAAVNEGLKLVTGEYLTGSDIDDEYTVNAIEEKVKFLEENQTYNFARNECIIKEEKTGKVMYHMKVRLKKKEEKIFKDLIMENDIWFVQGGYIFRSESFFVANKGREIYISREGQNYQLLLPIAYTQKCGYINKVLYIAYARDNSHSHTVRTYEQEKQRLENIKNIMLETMKKMEISDYDIYEKIVERKTKQRQMRLAYKYGNISIGNKMFDELTEKQFIDKITYKKQNTKGIKKKIIDLQEKMYINSKRIINFIRRYI